MVPESDKSVPQVVNELWSLTKDYARQETVDPLKGVGRYLAYGFGGAVLGGVGIIMLLLSLLRGLQEHGGKHLDGSMSWAPYAIVLVVGALLAAIAASRISKR